VIILNGFKQWDEWYKNRKIEITKVKGASQLPQNSGVILKGDGAEQLGIVRGEYIVNPKDYRPCGISSKNEEQRIALHILKDSDVPLKIISGVAGSGKTLLACAHALEQLYKGDKSKIVIAKSMTPVGREIGFLKGSMEDKVKPWLGPFYDNFIHCGYADFHIDKMVEMGQLEITPITFIQGRSISNAIIIIDEVQNLDLDVIKQIITRAAEGSEIILLGDQTQVFENRVKQRSIDILVEKAKPSELIGHVHLSNSLRSAIADWAVLNL